MAARLKTTVGQFTPLEWEVYHTMQDIDRSGVYPTMTLVCRAIPHREFDTVRRARSAILAWGLFEASSPAPARKPWTRQREGEEPYSAPTLTTGEIAEIDESRRDVLADSILDFLEKREKRGLVAEVPIWAEHHPDIIETMMSGLNHMPLAETCRAIVALWDRTFLRRSATPFGVLTR